MYSKLGLPSFRFGFSGDEASQTDLETITPYTGTSIAVHGSDGFDRADKWYAISGDGDISPVGEDIYIISGSGTVSKLDQNLDQNQANTYVTYGSAIAVIDNDKITFVGRGWGHNIGMSQYGAYAMAQQGKNYVDILKFYYTGIDVGQI